VIRSLLTVYCIGSFSTISAQQLILKSETVQKNTSVPTAIEAPKFSQDANLKPFEPTQFKSLNENVVAMDHDVVLVGKATPAGIDIYQIPLFGGFQKTLQQMESDEAFITDCDKNFKSRQDASLFFSDMGWQYLSEGSKEMAIYRFNLASLLDHKNVDVYWGLGVVEYQKGELEESIKLLSQGLYEDNKFNVALMVDLATVHLKCFNQNNHAFDLEKANKLLSNAILLAPNYAASYFQLAWANLLNGKIEEAWMAFHNGYKIDPTALDQYILEQLLNQKADPLGLFR
jgi:tetratricopeptide (TPR) repeat protein